MSDLIRSSIFGRTAKIAGAVIAACLLLGAGFAQSQATTGRVTINIVKAGFIVGVGGGSGTLNFAGKTYRFSVGGISVGTIGVAGVNLVGTASNLRSPGDIAGSYGAASGSVAIVAGAKVARLQNEKGVVLELSGPQVGLEASLNLGGMTITMQ